MNAFRPDVIIPLLAVLLSGQLALLFAGIYLTGLSRRPEYPAFSAFNLFLAVMMFFTFKYEQTQRFPAAQLSQHLSEALLALRWLFVAGFGAAGALYHFVFCLLRQEVTHRRTLIVIDVLAATMMAAAFSDSVFRLASTATDRDHIDQALAGPFFACYVVIGILFVATALWRLHRGLRFPERQPSDRMERVGDVQDHFDVLARYRRRILAGILVLFATCVIDAAFFTDLPLLRDVPDPPFSLRFLGLTFFCLQAASVLGIEIKRSELRKALLTEQTHILSQLARQRAEDLHHIHHDVGNRVDTVRMMLECAIDAAESGVDRSQLERDLLAVHEEVGSVNRLFDELLYRAQVAAGERPQHTRRESVDLPAWIQRLVDGKREAVEALRRQAELRGKESPPRFEFHVETHLDTMEHHIDTISLELILTNLLDNAVKYSPQGGAITVTLRDLPGALRICVSDTGAGIAVEDQQRIFELRDRGSRAFDATDGTGIGLHHVRRLLEEQGGAITVQSAGAPGQGSAFTLLLPETSPR